MQVLLLFGIYSADAFEGELHLTYPGITKQKSETQHEFRFLLSMLLSPKLFLLTQPQAQEEEQHAHPDDRWVAVLPAQLRHPLKIHPVPAHQQGEGEEDGGDDGEDLHDVVLADADLRLEHILDLGAILPQQLGLLSQADDSILEHLEQQRLLLGEEAVVVLAQLTGQAVDSFRREVMGAVNSLSWLFST